MAVRSEIRSLTGLRGVAAVLVLFYHAMSRGTGFQPLDRIIHHGYISVDLFFVLSGFVMAMTYGSGVVRGAVWQPSVGVSWASGRSYLSALCRRDAGLFPGCRGRAAPSAGRQ